MSSNYYADEDDKDCDDYATDPEFDLDLYEDEDEEEDDFIKSTTSRRTYDMQECWLNKYLLVTVIEQINVFDMSIKNIIINKVSTTTKCNPPCRSTLSFVLYNIRLSFLCMDI